MTPSVAVQGSGSCTPGLLLAGERVLINHSGDIRVRPTIFEVSLHTSEPPCPSLKSIFYRCYELG